MLGSRSAIRMLLLDFGSDPFLQRKHSARDWDPSGLDTSPPSQHAHGPPPQILFGRGPQRENYDPLWCESLVIQRRED